MIPLLRRYKFIVLGVFIIAAFFIFLQIYGKSVQSNEQNMIDLDGPSLDLINENEEEVMMEEVWVVDVKGAIKKPGVYLVSHDDRVIDVIDQAGGFAKKANENAINLAEKVIDEMVIYVPKIGEDETEVLLSDPGSINNNDGKIRMNHASLDEMTTLSGIGPKKAQAIIDYRDENGPFQQIEDILNIPGIGEKTLDNFRDDIIVP